MVIRNLFKFIVLCTFLVSCSTNVKYYESGEIRSVLTKSLFSENKLTYFYENGKKSAEGYVDESGCPIGKWTGYRAENDLFWECEYAENICLDTVIKSVAEQDMRCYIYKWMKQYYQGTVSMDYLRTDSLWNVRIFYRDYGKGKMYAYGDVDMSDKETGRWNYYYPDGKLAHSFVYEHGVGPMMPCEKVQKKISVDIAKVIEKDIPVYYFRLYTYDINPRYRVTLQKKNPMDTIPISIRNSVKEGEFCESMFPYRIEKREDITRQFGGTEEFISILVSFEHPKCEQYANDVLIVFSAEDMHLRNSFYDEKIGKFLIERESEK